MKTPRSSCGGWSLLDCAWFFACGVASSVWCLTAAAELGATFDEPTYIARGLERWRTGECKGLMRLGTMPLPVDLATLPLHVAERWRGPVDSASELDDLLPWSRATTLVFWWLLLFYGWRAGAELAGPWGARLAVPMPAAEPSLLAHASLATTDIAVSACLLGLAYQFRIARERNWSRRVLLPAAWFAAALLAKASALVFGPLCLLAIEFDRVIRGVEGTWGNSVPAPTLPAPSRGGRPSGNGTGRLAASPWWDRLREGFDAVFPQFWRDSRQILGLALLMVFLYCGSDWQQEPSFVAWAKELPEGRTQQVMLWLSEHLRFFSNAGEGLVQQVKHNVRGHGTFLLGETWPRACWYYFPVALTIKLTVPLLLLPLVLGVVKPRALVNWACIAAAVLFALSITYRVQIGIRLVLPLISLAIVGFAAAVVQAIGECSSRLARRTLAGGVAVGIVWTTGSAAVVWPHALCYTNELWGGTGRGYLRLSDSNYDWGQGLKELARREQQDGLSPMAIWYYGTDPALKKLPVRDLPFHVLPVEGPQDIIDRVGNGYLAVSTTLLYGTAFTDSHRRAAAFLRTCPPVARTATSLIYDFSEIPRDEHP